MGNSTRKPRIAILALLVLWLGPGFGCATPGSTTPRYDYFASPTPNDPWSRKIHRWQLRERSDQGEDGLRAPAAVAQPPDRPPEAQPLPARLEEKYRSFRAEQKRSLARQVADWVQAQARIHYVPDGPVDRWATLAETFRQDGDDCDGLELLTFHLLRELGFHEDEVYRAIVYRRSDGQHHMVTLWFENRDDPWVIDPTGAMTSGMPQMSQVPGWVPLKVFSDDRDFTVERIRFAAAH